MVGTRFLKKRSAAAASASDYTAPGKTKRLSRASAICEVERLKTELELLTSYSTDTIYRLRYDTMEYDYISSAVTRLLGFTPEEMKEINFRSLILETKIVTDGMRTVDSFDALEKTRYEGDVNKWQADYLIRTKDGRQIWVSDVSYPWFNEKGEVIGSVGSLHDISDRVNAEQQVKEELAKIANTDALTGLSNRRELFDALEAELKRSRRTGCEVSLMILDIDRFKEVNDKHGHDVGDMVLIEMSAVIQSCLRETDIAARIGGEEFAVMLPETPPDGAYWVAERIRMSVLKHNFSSGADKKPISCTISIGVATAIGDEDVDSSALYKVADTRLYIAKNTGRNQVSIDEILHTH